MMIFDCNVHPTVSGTWSDGRAIGNFQEIQRKLIDENFCGAAAVGLPGIGLYDDLSFISHCRDWNWAPIAAWLGCDQNEIVNHIEKLKNLGYFGIKVHPRMMGFMPEEDILVEIFNAASRHDLRVLFCTYPCHSAHDFKPIDILSLLQTALHKAPDVALMLMHSGGYELLRYVEFARANPQITLDLSFTLMKYKGSSVDLDIAFAFQNFDQRIVIGSDYPDYGFRDVRVRFENLSVNLSQEKCENIAWRNASKFFAIGLT